MLLFERAHVHVHIILYVRELLFIPLSVHPALSQPPQFSIQSSFIETLNKGTLVYYTSSKHFSVFLYTITKLMLRLAMSSPAPPETEPNVIYTCHVDPTAPQLIAFDPNDSTVFAGPRAGVVRKIWQTPIMYRGPTQADAIDWINRNNTNILRDRLFPPCPQMTARDPNRDNPVRNLRSRINSAFVRSKLSQLLPQYPLIVNQGADFIEAIEQLDRTFQDSPGVLIWSNIYSSIFDGIVEVQKTSLCARCYTGLYCAPNGRAQDDDYQQLFLDGIYDQMPTIRRYRRIVLGAKESKKASFEADERADEARNKAAHDHSNVEAARQTVFNVIRGPQALFPSTKHGLDDADHIDPEAGKRPRTHAHVEAYTRLTDDEKVRNYGQSVVDSLTTTIPERISRIRADAEEWACKHLLGHGSLEIEAITRFQAAIEAAPQELLAINSTPLTRPPVVPMTLTRRSRAKGDPSVFIWRNR